MKKLFIILILISSSYVLGYTGSGYQYGYSAKSFALSDALVADNYQTFQTFSNPSSLYQCSGTHYGISYFGMSLDRSIQNFYFSRSLPGNAGISLAILRSSSGNFMGKDSFNNPTHEISMSDYYGVLSFGVKAFGNNAIGLSMKLHYSNLNINEEHTDSYTGNSVALDLGWSKSISDQLKLGLKAHNIISPGLNWSIDIGSGLPSSYTEEYPLILSIGSLYKPHQNHKILFQYDYINYDSYTQYISKLGYQYLINDKLSLRLGLKGTKDIRFGFGYSFDINDTLPLLLDYSLHLGSENEGISHLFTWSFNIR